MRGAEITGMPTDDALLELTPLYLNFGLGRSFDPAEPTWQEFLAGYRLADDPVDWTYDFYLGRARDYTSSPYGCFSYHYEPEDRTIRFHFANRDSSGTSPLRQERQVERRRELKAMFGDVRREVPEAAWVRGRSWLYNLDAYTRLFPPEYIRAAAPTPAELQFMSQWGQLLDHGWNVREAPAQIFSSRLAAANTFDGLLQSFPLPVLAPRCEIGRFYAFYGLDQKSTNRE